MSREYLVHITAAGERWDMLAARYYGDPARYALIVAANPHVPISPMLASGVMLAIPVFEEDDVVPAEELPPWKR